MNRGGSFSSEIRLRLGWPRIRSSILSRNNRPLFPKVPPAQFLPRALSPALNRPAKDAGHFHPLQRFRMSGEMPPPPHTLSWSIQGNSVLLILQHKCHDFHVSLGSATREQDAANQQFCESLLWSFLATLLQIQTAI